ncbi:Biopolymer transport protein ExbB [Anaerohalosphaera lusitana]|uniref:Biopolymer transport protein ExbB n=1 Tax=Anaerohalosphaera lusitana TaxID=1936003 RepID=A0A1U9NLT3_9BACT|nr:MotA/TolQ/ExbB proton channel family protein [Anaerohalosphaera lusitana]AQT68795.1 Biopolymer transport protein ExbB [Anaerohalosphaera lusitana]
MKITKIISIILLFAAMQVFGDLTDGDEASVTELQNLADPLVSSEDEPQSEFGKASQSAKRKMEESVAELAELRKQIADKTIPLTRQLNDLEEELSEVRREYQETSRLLDTRTLDLSNLRNEIKARKEEASYISNLMGQFAVNFEARLHIAEIQRYKDTLEHAKTSPENSNLSKREVFKAQSDLIQESLEGFEQAIGGKTFHGKAVDSTGLVNDGKFVLIGPAALFKSEDGQKVGTVEQRFGSLEPTIIPFANEQNKAAASELISNESGRLPLDPTLGNAHVVESTNQTLVEHVQKGGPVMIPILGMAGLAMLVALYKWIALSLIPKPGKRKINKLLDAVESRDPAKAEKAVQSIKGPVGKMLRRGVEHIKEPAELIEELMYETVLDTKLKLERFLPFVAISAAAAPLLGLLGTVTGIINTFKLITVFGSGDVKTLSGGISEALITTEFGLIVAIPSLLLHAFLSRKAKRFANDMEKAAVAFVNQVSKTPVKKNDLPEKVKANA